MNIRNVSPTPWRAVALVGVFIAVLVAAVAPADASHPTIWDPKVHWNNASTDWHWGSALEDHHTDFKLPSDAAWWLTWRDACCPDSPWHPHYDTSAPSHVNTIFYTPNTAGRAVTTYDGNSAFHMIKVQIDFNHQFYDNVDQTVDVMYRGAGTPLFNQLDAWSVASEEWGHLQNIDHFGVSCDTMYHVTTVGQTCKRSTNPAERQAAIEGWELSHP